MKPPRCSNGRAGYAGRVAMLVGRAWSMEGGKTKSDSFSPAGAAAYCTSLRTVTTKDAAIAEASESSSVRRFGLKARGLIGGGTRMTTKLASIQKCAWGFAALFLGVYLLDYVPRVAQREPASLWISFWHS